MQVHDLKCNSESFEAIQSGAKRGELRWNDRDYHAGDLLALHRTVPGTPGIDDGPVVVGDDPELVRVTHVMLGGQYGLAEGYALLSIERIRVTVVR